MSGKVNEIPKGFRENGVNRSDDTKNPDGTMKLPNTYLKNLSSDSLYHLGLDTVKYNLPEMFGDVKFVVMGGTKHRMREFAYHMTRVLGVHPAGDLTNLIKHSHRYAMFKIGPVLSVSHGMGVPSLTILLQELFKLMYYAKAKDPVFLRLGTSGGLNMPPGSVVISTWGLNGLLEKSYNIPILGELRKFPAYFDQKLGEELQAVASEMKEFETHLGGTFVADDFYRGQARLDGPFCNHTEGDKMKFLEKLIQLGVKNIEMEATALAAMTAEAGVRGGDVCVTLINRMLGDQVTMPKSVISELQKRPMIVIGEYIKKSLSA